MNKNIRGTLRVIILIALFIALASVYKFFFSTPYPPYEREVCTDADDYMKVNAYVEELLYTSYTNFFPAEIQSDDSINYYYDYSFSDRELHLTLYLEQGFDSDAQFNAEIVRLKSFPHASEVNCGSIDYVIFDMPDEDKIADYIREVSYRDRTWDFFFSLARLDNERMRIAYLLSFEYDNTEKKAVTLDFLESYLEDMRNVKPTL